MVLSRETRLLCFSTVSYSDVLNLLSPNLPEHFLEKLSKMMVGAL